ncbi:class I SAM-dependent DNA methyltransferase [uncultured Jatrophihabitans sp.]|uniref:class I SAM-dependent DNA methyltransferase n=1 Tax=uncultured Jatrophihabitans sp. TaxID=1610747 RepID=UPI0035CA60EC
MTDSLLAKADDERFSDLFRFDLFWHSPDQPPILTELENGHTITATNVSSYKGVRVWEVPALPGSAVEAQLDQAIAKSSTNRLVIFHDGEKQVWRWPSRISKGGGVTSRPARHVHHVGNPDPRFLAKLDAIRLPNDSLVDVNDLLSRVRAAFDVETKNETKRASKLMAQMYAAVEKGYLAGSNRKKRDHEISVTLARVLFLLFGDDTEMWKAPSGEPVPDLFQDFVKDHTARDGSDIAQRVNELFEVLDTPDAKRGGLAAGLGAFPYVNGGIFQERITLPTLDSDFRDAVLAASAVDWSTISPAIFGSMFQSVRDAQTRRELGEHYTSEANILKTLNPLFLDELRAEFDHILTLQKGRRQKLNDLWKRIGDIRYMDPACGCGNFIIVAYRELRDLELRIMDALATLTDGMQAVALTADWTHTLKVTLDHFYGIEIDEWPARIAETAMFLIDRQCDLKMKERFGVAPERLPIQRAATVVVGNALQTDWQQVCQASQTVVIAGNPPFLGHNTRTAEQSQELRRLWKRDDIGRLDYVTGWYVKAMQYFAGIEGRWALVSTNSIVQGEPVATLFEAVYSRGWKIRFAHRTFAWESEAAGAATVHCVIIGFERAAESGCQLFDYERPDSRPNELSARHINAYLCDGPDVLVEQRRQPMAPDLRSASFGSRPNDGGALIVTPEEYAMISEDQIAAQYLRRFVGSRELLHGQERWCLWLVDAPMAHLSQSPVLRERLLQCRQHRASSKRKATREWADRPHLFDFNSQPSTAFLCVPSVVSEQRDYFTAKRFGPEVVASNLAYSLADDDGLQFGVISSSMFITWQRTIGGRLESRLRFTNTIVWNNFPLPRLDRQQKRKIIEATAGIEEARREDPRSLAEQYEPGMMREGLRVAHETLDKAVDRVFGLRQDKPSEQERQAALFEQYTRMSEPH